MIFDKRYAKELMESSLDSGSSQEPMIARYLAYYKLPADSNYTFTFLEVNKKRIFLQKWRHNKAKGSVFLVHGFGDHAGLFGSVIRFFLSRSYNVIIFDLPGHGLSQGAPLFINTFTDYTEVLHACYEKVCMEIGGAWFFLGQSTGAAIIIESFLTPLNALKVNTKGIILMAPLVRITKWYRTKLLFFLLSFFKNRVKRQITTNSHDSDFVRFLKSDPLQCDWIDLRWLSAFFQWESGVHPGRISCEIATFIVQGTEDPTVAWRYNLPLLQKLFPNSTTCLVQGGYHHLVNEIEAMRSHYFDALDPWLKKTGK